MKQILIFLLIAGHIIVNGVAAAVHMTEEYNHCHETQHQHFFSNDEIVSHDDGHHEHEEGAHMHLEFQLSDAQQYLRPKQLVTHHDEIKRAFSSAAYAPPVPPPND
jgi:hypothetical protein